jgi:ubiquitin carboxyl-terminal hydrolase 25/28
LFTKSEQSQLPVVGEDPSHETVYKIASCCTKCRWHVDVRVAHIKEGSEDKPCGKGNTDYALHHFCHSRDADTDGMDGLNAQLQPRTYTFYCSAPECPVTATITFKPPRFSGQDIETLTNQAQLRRRWEAAKQLAGDRADTTMARKVDGPDYLNTYLNDSMKPSKGKSRIPLLNKKFLKTFGRDCDSILQSLGFESHQEEDSDGVMSIVWYLPKPEERESPLETTTLRNKIEDALFELNTIILDMSESERAGCRHTPRYPTPSQGDIERALACADCTYTWPVARVVTDRLYRCQGERTGDTQHNSRRGPSVRTPLTLSRCSESRIQDCGYLRNKTPL